MTARSATFQRALSTFSHGLAEDEAEDFRFTTLEDVHQVIKNLQEEQGRKRTMMDLSRIHSFLEAMEQYGKVIEVFLNTTNFLAFVWGPIKLLLQIASTWAEAFDTLLDAYQRIGENIPLLRQYQAMFADNAYMQGILELIYKDILEFHRRALKFFKQRAWKQLFRCSWKDFRTRFQSILENLRRHKDLIESQASLAQYQSSRVARQQAEIEIQKIEEAMVKQQLVSVRDWLCSAKVKNDQEHYVSVRVYCLDFGKWLLSHARMRIWMDPDSSSIPLLWLHGIPGAGKSTLASLIIEESLRIPNTAVAFFYCKHGDFQKNTFIAIAKSILVQLLCNNKQLLSFIYEASCTSGESSLGTLPLAKDLLNTALRSMENVMIIIDGLDECGREEKKSTIMWLKSAIEAAADETPGKVRCLFVSQDDGDIRKLLTTVPEIQMRPEDNRTDIEAYTKYKATDIQKKFDLLDSRRDEIVAKVRERTEGMFLFAKLVMLNLFNQTSRGRMNDELLPDRFPRGLEQAYARIVESICKDPGNPQTQDAKRLLGWLACAKRPLKWHEIQGAMSIDVPSGTVEFEDRQLRVSSKDLCGSLVEIHLDGTVELVHLTARFYLVSHKHIFLEREEYNLACLCLAYLNFQCFEYELSKPDIEKYISEGFYAFQDYAVVHWVDHLSSSVEEMDALDSESLLRLESLIRRFVQTRSTDLPVQASQAGDIVRKFRRFSQHEYFDKLIQVVTQATGQKDSRVHKDNSQPEISYLAAQIELVRFNLERMTVSLLSTSAMHAKYEMFYGSSWYKCPRMDCVSFYRGFPDPAHRDRHKNQHNRPFQCSYLGCHIASVGCRTAKELEKHKLDFHSLCRNANDIFPAQGLVDSTSPLETLAWRGDLEAIERRLDAKNNNLSDYDHRALSAAASKGYDIIVSRLLRCNWDKHLLVKRPLHIFEALQKAVFHSKEATFMLIVTQEGIEFDSPTLCDGRLLLTAAMKGCGAMMDLLQQRCHSLNYNFLDRNKGTPIICAARNNHLGVVRQLLESNKIDLDLAAMNGKTAVLCAAENGHPRIVQVLLQYDDVSRYSADWLGVAQLYAGARDGNEKLLVALLDEVNIPKDLYSREGYSPFLIAVKNGHEAVVELFLHNAQADPNAKTKIRSTRGRQPSALGLAARYGHESVVQLLLAKQGIDLQYESMFRDRGFIVKKAQDIAKHFGHNVVAALIQKAELQVANQALGKTQVLEATDTLNIPSRSPALGGMADFFPSIQTPTRAEMGSLLPPAYFPDSLDEGSSKEEEEKEEFISLDDFDFPGNDLKDLGVEKRDISGDR